MTEEQDKNKDSQDGPPPAKFFLEDSADVDRMDDEFLYAPTVQIQPGKQKPKNAERGLDRFKIEKQLAVGGMGVIYKAIDSRLNKIVALKVMNADALDRTNLLRFQNEARTLSRLSHPGIAAVYDFGVSKSGQPFMAIEFVDGITLTALLKASSFLPWEVAAEIFVQICNVCRMRIPRAWYTEMFSLITLCLSNKHPLVQTSKPALTRRLVQDLRCIQNLRLVQTNRPISNIPKLSRIYRRMPDYK